MGIGLIGEICVRCPGCIELWEACTLRKMKSYVVKIHRHLQALFLKSLSPVLFVVGRMLFVHEKGKYPVFYRRVEMKDKAVSPMILLA